MPHRFIWADTVDATLQAGPDGVTTQLSPGVVNTHLDVLTCCFWEEWGNRYCTRPCLQSFRSGQSKKNQKSNQKIIISILWRKKLLDFANDQASVALRATASLGIRICKQDGIGVTL